MIEVWDFVSIRQLAEAGGRVGEWMYRHISPDIGFLTLYEANSGRL